VDSEQCEEVAFVAVLVKGQQRGILQGEQRQAREERVAQRDIGGGPGVGDALKPLAEPGEQSIGGEVLPGCGQSRNCEFHDTSLCRQRGDWKTGPGLVTRRGPCSPRIAELRLYDESNRPQIDQVRTCDAAPVYEADGENSSFSAEIRMAGNCCY
jgi:hypothetical protein